MANEIAPFKQLMEGLAERFGVTPQEMIDTLKMQCFPGGAATNGQLMMLCSFAKQYDLNPLARECYAFIGGGKNPGKMTVGVEVDGWTKIANRHRDEDNRLDYDGQEMEYERSKDGELIAITSKTYVKNRRFPTVYRAVMKEWNRAKSSDVWNEMPEHQLFIKAKNEGIRFAFGVSAYDPDDLERIAAAQGTTIEVKAEKPKQIEETAQQQPAMPPAGPEQPDSANADSDGAELIAPSVDSDKSPAAVRETSNIRAHLDALIAKKVTAARLNLIKGQNGVEEISELTDEQVEKVIAMLERK